MILTVTEMGKYYREGVATLDNIQLTCINSQKIVGRHSSNRNGDSFMRLEQRPVRDKEYTNAESCLCFITHYSCGFGHRFNGMLGSYATYLKKYKREAADMKLLHFNSTLHVTGLNALFAEIEQKDLYLVEDNKPMVIKKLVFFNPSNYRVRPQNLLAISTIQNYLKTTPDYTNTVAIPLIAVLKTTYVRALDNVQSNPHGNLDGDRMVSILSAHGVTLLDHSKLTVKQLIILIMKSTLLVLNWGATSAWHNFLDATQRCYCILPFSYRREVNSNDLCFNKACFKNYTVSRPIRNNIPKSDERFIISDLKKLL